MIALQTVPVAFFLLMAGLPFATAQDYNWIEQECPAAFDVTGQVVSGPAGKGKAKLVLNYRDANDHVALALAGDQLKAVDVVSGKVEELLPPVVLPAAASRSFLLKWRGDALSIIVDGRYLGRVQSKHAPGGRIGVSVEGDCRFEGLRVQEVPPVYFTDDFMRTEDQAGEWETLLGKWETKSIESVRPDPAKSANPFSYAVASAETNLTTAGYWFWDNYLCEASVKPEASGAVGLVVLCQDKSNYVLFRWWSADAERGDKARELVFVRDGQESVVRTAAGGYEQNEWYRLAARVTDRQLRFDLDGAEVFAVDTVPFFAGRVGLYATECEAASFDDVFCKHWESPTDDPSPRLRYPHFTPQFREEESMKKWADPDFDWQPGENNWWWHRGEFWGEASFSAELPDPAGTEATAALVIHAQRGDPDSGYLLATTSAADGSHIACKLAREGKVLGTRTVAAGDWPVLVEVRRQRDLVVVEVEDERVLSIFDPKPLSGTGTALRTTGKRIPTAQLIASGTHYLDDTFSSAPVDWWQASGKWQVTNRWHCSPQWSWMAGWKSQAPTLWSKHAFGGDFIVEAYVCNKMEELGPNAYTHPGDLNVTVCGDGADVGSGYSFLYAGWNNTASGAFRQGEECVERNARAVMVNPSAHNMAFHRNWFHVRVERRGNHLRHFVEDELISEFDDPNPLPSGRVALWTLGNDALTSGLVVARVRVWYEAEAEAPPFPRRTVTGAEGNPWQTALEPTPEDVTQIHHDFEQSDHHWSGFNRMEGAVTSLDDTTAASGRRSLRLVNASSGGDFTVWAGVGPFKPSRLGTLRFAYRIPPEVKVNLYVHARGRYYAVEFTAGPQPRGTCPTIGKIDGVQTDDAWHQAEFDLKSALAAAGLTDEAVEIDQLCFGSPAGTYYRAGLGGNGWGATWHLDDFWLGG